METTRHFTTSVYIVYNHKVLLHMHKSLDVWLPVGGHIDRDELPHECAIREAKEESGIDIKLWNNQENQSDLIDTKELISPVHVLLENIQPGHQHIDSVFYATCDAELLNPQINEAKQLQWFTNKELETLETLDNVKVCAKEALRLIAKVIIDIQKTRLPQGQLPLRNDKR